MKSSHGYGLMWWCRGCVLEKEFWATVAVMVGLPVNVKLVFCQMTWCVQDKFQCFGGL